MTNPENPAFNHLTPEMLGINPTFEVIARTPKTVVSQTDAMIDLFWRGKLSYDFLQNYVSTYTAPFLESAAQGAERVFERRLDRYSIFSAPEDLRVNEAADFSNMVFGWMHYFAQSAFLPNGFAKNGLLKAPQTREEFVHRLREIKFQLALILTGDKDRSKPIESDMPALRTYHFFRVGAVMPLKFPESEKEKEERTEEMMKTILEDIDADFFKES